MSYAQKAAIGVYNTKEVAVIVSHVQKAAVDVNLVQKATVDVHRDQWATVDAPHVQHTIVDVQNSAVEPHFQSSVVGGPHQEVALPGWCAWLRRQWGYFL